MRNLISCIEPLGFPFKTLDPFLFCVYHQDFFPPGDEKMQAPRRGNGADFDWSKPYRMYHGDRIPGFPQVTENKNYVTSVKPYAWNEIHSILIVDSRQ